MARSRESRTLEFEDGDLPELEEKPRRPRASAKAKPEISSRKRLLLALVFVFFLVVFIAAVALAYQVDTFLATDPRFSLTSFQRDGLLLADGPIELIGVEHAPAQEVLALFEPDVGRSLYLLPLDARRTQLMAIDWVEYASISRIWPNRLQVAIQERTPIALAATPTRRRGDAYQMMLVDRHGILMRLPKQARFDLPVIFGLSPDQAVEFREARIELLDNMQAEVKALETRFTELDVSDPNNLKASLSLDGRNLKLLLGRDKYLERVQTFLEQYSNVLKANPQANLFDMRLENQIVASREGLAGA
jgi:cell division protein FtsQ